MLITFDYAETTRIARQIVAEAGIPVEDKDVSLLTYGEPPVRLCIVTQSPISIYEFLPRYITINGVYCEVIRGERISYKQWCKEKGIKWYDEAS